MHDVWYRRAAHIDIPFPHSEPVLGYITYTQLICRHSPDFSHLKSELFYRSNVDHWWSKGQRWWHFMLHVITYRNPKYLIFIIMQNMRATSSEFYSKECVLIISSSWHACSAVVYNSQHWSESCDLLKRSGNPETYAWGEFWVRNRDWRIHWKARLVNDSVTHKLCTDSACS